MTTKFEDWWPHYPKKVAKIACKKKWASKKLDPMTEKLIEDVINRKNNCPRWKAGYIPDPLTYLNQERWEDEIEKPIRKLPRTNKELDDYVEQRGIKTEKGESYAELRQRIINKNL